MLDHVCREYEIEPAILERKLLETSPQHAVEPATAAEVHSFGRCVDALCLTERPELDQVSACTAARVQHT
jgi:hypothetical protein